MDTRDLRSFVAVAECVSFTRAAAELDYAQSTVTGHVRSLEREFGVELFQRAPGGIRITVDGVRILAYAKTVLALTAEAQEHARRDAEPAGSVQLATMDSLNAYRLLPFMEYLHLRYPKITLQVRPSLCAQTAAAVQRGDLDCGFVIDERDSFPGLESEVLCVEPMVLVAGRRHDLAGRSSVSLADIRAEARVLGTEQGCSYRDRFQELLTASAPQPFPVLELGTIESIKRGAESGLGVALLPRVTVESELARGSLVALPWSCPFTMRTQILWRPAERLSRVMQVLLDAARKTTNE